MSLQGTYQFFGGFPDPDTVTQAYDRADFIRAVSCYKHFFPAVSGLAIFAGTAAAGITPNRVFGTMDTRPGQIGFTLNSDTPYAPVLLDLSSGPLILEIPPGPIVGALLNVDQSWIADVGIAGPDAGKGGRHIVVPPAFTGELPAKGFAARASGTRAIAGLRAIPTHGDASSAIALLRAVQVSPLHEDASWEAPEWIDLTGKPQNTTPNSVQATLDYWRSVHEYISTEPVHHDDRTFLGELRELGISAGQPFEPNERMRTLLTAAAEEADAQMRVQSLADRRPDRVVWADRQWEWVTLRPENGRFEIDGYLDVVAQQTWFYQAIAASPAMFRRQPGAGSLYWFAARDAAGGYLDGARTYRLRVPLPVPAALFWSFTVYDAQTRSQIGTPQGNAALRSLFELDGKLSGDHIDLYIGPDQPAHSGAWVQTTPGRGWFAYFRLYGPQSSAFDSSWKLGDIAAISSET